MEKKGLGRGLSALLADVGSGTVRAGTRRGAAASA